MAVSERLRTGAAARVLGVHVDTLRGWADEGRIPSVRVSGQRRFLLSDLNKFLGVGGHAAAVGEFREVLYVRVSGSTGQESSLAAQEAELRSVVTGQLVRVYKDRGSGLSEKRTGLTRLLRDAHAGKFDVVRVTHADRLARFGVKWLIQMLSYDGVEVVVLHEKQTTSGMDELLADFMSLVASFSGRLYGIRSKEAKDRLLSVAAGTVHDPNPKD